MTIRRGEDWGEVDVAIEPGTPIFRDEAAATPLVQAAFDRAEPIPAFALRSGDLHRTLGGTQRDGRISATGGAAGSRSTSASCRSTTAARRACSSPT